MEEEGRSRRAHEPRTATAAAGAAEEATLLQRSHRRENGGAKPLGKVLPVWENGPGEPLLSGFGGGSCLVNLSVDFELCVFAEKKRCFVKVEPKRSCVVQDVGLRQRGLGGIPVGAVSGTCTVMKSLQGLRCCRIKNLCLVYMCVV